MKKAFIFIAVILISMFCFASPVFAFTAKSGENLNITETVNDDVYSFGNNITLTGNINGDLITAGGQIIVNGNVAADLTAAGGQITVNGNVNDDIRIAGGMITINNKVTGDAVIAGGQINITKNTVINGDLIVTGGKIIVEGEVKGKVEINGGQVDFAGKSEKDVNINAADITILSSAVINGNLNYTSENQAKIAEGSKISGKTNWTKVVPQKVSPKISQKARGGGIFGIFATTWIGSKIFNFVNMFILGILLILAIPKVFKKFNGRMKSSFGICTGAGAIGLFGIPIAVLILGIIGVILLFTVIGSAVGFSLFIINTLILILYIVLVYFSSIFLSFFIGNLIFSRSGMNLDKYGWKVLTYLVGLAIISVICAIPFIGWIVNFAAILFGFGGIIMIIWDWLFSFKKAK